MTTEPTETVAEATIADVENNIRNILKAERGRPTMPLKVVEQEPTAPTPLPVDEVGHMAADAVRKVYETTAKQVEDMGDEVKDRIVSLGAALKEAEIDLKALADAAQAIRAKGAAVSAMVEQAAGTSKAIRDLAADFKTRVASGNSV